MSSWKKLIDQSCIDLLVFFVQRYINYHCVAINCIKIKQANVAQQFFKQCNETVNLEETVPLNGSVKLVQTYVDYRKKSLVYGKNITKIILSNEIKNLVHDVLGGGFKSLYGARQNMTKGGKGDKKKADFFHDVFCKWLQSVIAIYK